MGIVHIYSQQVKVGNLWAAYCLHFAYYNFCCIHQTLGVTPAMEAGISGHIWSVRELLEVAWAWQPVLESPPPTGSVLMWQL